jgi:hypothetical protein
MIRAVLGVLLLTLIAPLPVAAQGAGDRPATIRARAQADGDTTLALANVRLVVPRDAVEPGAIVALGVGGIPAAEAGPGSTSILVSAAGGLRMPVVALIAPRVADRARLRADTPAVRDVATGQRAACAGDGRWIACPILRPGAYALETTAEPPAADALLHDGLTGLAVQGSGGRAPNVLWLLLIAAAALSGGAAAWLFERRQQSPQRAH